MDKIEESVNQEEKLDDKLVKSDGETVLLAKRRRNSEDAKPAAKRRRYNSRSFKNEGKCSGRKHKKKSAEFTFHLGGSISDPLNLEGLSGSGHDCTTCPPSPSSLPAIQQQPSPLPPHRRHDPLNLEGTQKEGQHVDKPKKRKRSKSTRARSVSKGQIVRLYSQMMLSKALQNQTTSRRREVNLLQVECLTMEQPHLVMISHHLYQPNYRKVKMKNFAMGTTIGTMDTETVAVLHQTVG